MACLLEYFSTFGVCYSWVSEQGTYFQNEVIEALQHALGAHHHFTTARCSWANGTVDVVNRELELCARKLLSEWRLPTSDWHRVLPIIQMALNQTPSRTLGNALPLTVMTGLTPKSPIEHVVAPVEPITALPLSEIRANVADQLTRLHESLVPF
jgi:hypothetical protein